MKIIDFVKNMRKKVINLVLFLFLPFLLISCSLQIEEKVEFPSSNEDSGLIYSIDSRLEYVSSKSKCKLNEELQLHFIKKYTLQWHPYFHFMKNNSLIGVAKLDGFNVDNVYIAYGLEFDSQGSYRKNEFYYFTEKDILDLVKKKDGYDAISIEQINRGYAYIDNIDFYYVVRIDEENTVNSLETVFGSGPSSIRYMDKYIPEQKDYYEEMKKRTGIEIDNVSDPSNPQYTKDEKTFKMDENFLESNSLIYKRLVKKMKEEGTYSSQKSIVQIEDRLFLTIKYSSGDNMWPSTFVFEIAPTSGNITYLGDIPQNSTLFGAVSF